MLMLHFSPLHLSSSLGLFESFHRNIVHLPILDPNLLPHRPEILTILHDAQIKRIHRARTRRRERKTMRSSPPRKSVESEEVEQEPTARPRRGRHSEDTPMSVIMLTYPAFCFAFFIAPLGA